jgi:hypothetical protein
VSYKFLLTADNGQTWTVLQTWSTTASVKWIPTQAGTYSIGVWARSAGSTADIAQAANSIPFTVGQ